MAAAGRPLDFYPHDIDAPADPPQFDAPAIATPAARPQAQRAIDFIALARRLAVGGFIASLTTVSHWTPARRRLADKYLRARAAGRPMLRPSFLHPVGGL
jgi:hypothetical protein